MLFIIIIIFTIIFVFFGIFLLIQYNRKDPNRIFGVYSQPGKWFYLKYTILYVIFTAEKLKKYYEKYKGKMGITDLERLQPLSTDDNAFDAVVMQAVNDDGYYLSAGLERRHRARVNVVFYIMIPKLGLLRSKHLPETLQPVDAKTLLELKEYAGAGLTITPVEPMARWKLNLDTKMMLVEENRLVDVKLDAVWTTQYPYFMFDNDISTKSIAQSIATEKWNKKLFKNLKSAHQTYYEQMGFVKGTLTVDGDMKDVQLYGFRNHSFGHKRDWSLMHRYIHHIMHLVNGIRLSVCVISQPCTTSHLTLGYVLKPNADGATGKHVLVAIEECDLQLYQHGENGRPSKDTAFTCRTTDGAVYEIKVHSLSEDEHFKGNDTEARLIERFVTCEVNGIKGRGISEWHYNTDRVYFDQGKSKPKFYLGCDN